MPIQRCQAETTSTDFVDWIWFMDWEELHGFHRMDHYLAQIAAEISRTMVKKPGSVKIEQFLLKFTSKSKSKKKRVPTQAELERYTAASKARWAGIAGLTKKG